MKQIIIVLVCFINLFASLKSICRDGMCWNFEATKIPSFIPESSYDRRQIARKLTPMQYQVTQNHQMEPPGEHYDKFFQKGKYNCIVCDQHLFNSRDKYYADDGYPSFNDASHKVAEVCNNEKYRIDALCINCGAYLGHVQIAKKHKSGKDFIINSNSLQFYPAENFKEKIFMDDK